MTEVVFEGFDKLAKRVRAIRRHVSDPKRFWRGVDTVLSEEAAEAFKTEGAGIGENWPPLDPRYARAKRRRFGRRKMLVATGASRRALTKRGRNHVAIARPSGFIWGERVGVMGFHQWPQPGAPYPARRVMALDDRTAENIEDAIGDAFEAAWDGAR